MTIMQISYVIMFVSLALMISGVSVMVSETSVRIVHAIRIRKKGISEWTEDDDERCEQFVERFGERLIYASCVTLFLFAILSCIGISLQ